MVKRQSIPLSIQKRLYAYSGCECAFYECNTSLFVEESENASPNIGEICHIEGLNKGSARHNPSNKDPNTYENLILLCANHHKEIDDLNNSFTVDSLKEMKKKHEDTIRERSKQHVQSELSKVINWINKIDIEKIEEAEVRAFGIESKINYNNVVEFRSTLDECKIYQGKLNAIYNELQYIGHIARVTSFLDNIRAVYRQVRRETLKGQEDIENIRINADNLIQNVIDYFVASLQKEKYNHFDFIFALEIIIVDAFMRCKILEEPINDH